jgi:hypothetical protein
MLFVSVDLDTPCSSVRHSRILFLLSYLSQNLFSCPLFLLLNIFGLVLSRIPKGDIACNVFCITNTSNQDTRLYLCFYCLCFTICRDHESIERSLLSVSRFGNFPWF